MNKGHVIKRLALLTTSSVPSISRLQISVVETVFPGLLLGNRLTTPASFKVRRDIDSKLAHFVGGMSRPGKSATRALRSRQSLRRDQI